MPSKKRPPVRPKTTHKGAASGATPKATPKTAKAPSRNTASGPSHPAAPPANDVLAKKVAATEKLAAAVSVNPNKPGEFGRKNAVNPPKGFTVDAAVSRCWGKHRHRA